MDSLSRGLPGKGMAKSKLDFVAPIFGHKWRIKADHRLPKDTDGDCCRVLHRIRVHSSLPPEKFFETLLHECLHAGYDHLDEEWVAQFAREFAPILYRAESLARCGLQRITPEG